MAIRHFEPGHSPFWNIAILTLMAAGVAVAYAAATLAAGTERLWVQAALWAIAAQGCIVSLVVFYARFVEPFWIAVRVRTVPFPSKKSLRIAVIGDFHVNEEKGERFIDNAVRRCNELSPDLVFLVGDFVANHRSDIRPLAVLRELRATHGVFAVIGNHDSSSDHMPGAGHFSVVDRSADLVQLLEPLGIRFLRNASVTIDVNGETIHLAGIDDIWMESCDLRKAFKNIPAGAPTILLSHQPDIILDPASHRCDLIVAGHTHAGQVRLPWLGSVSRLPQRLNNKFDQGVFPVTPRCSLAITSGIGETHLPLRFLSRPEILVLETSPRSAPPGMF